jgi:hypothetical protein
MLILYSGIYLLPISAITGGLQSLGAFDDQEQHLERDVTA